MTTTFHLPTYHGVRWLFPRLLAGVYLIAFLSWDVQFDGLVGSQGIMPLKNLMENIQAYELREGKSLLWEYPTIFRWAHSDAFAHGLIRGCAGLAVLVMAGACQRWLLLLLWAGYLSLMITGDVFMSFQWDALLLEAGLLGVWLAPGKLWQGGGVRLPPRGSVFLLHWLLFRLMFFSGLVKVAGGDPVWLDMTALKYHYETQPLPHILSWWVHQWPLWAHQASCWIMHFIELGLPFAIFLGRWGRISAALGFTALMTVVIFTGNYNFFNLLTIALAWTCLDDSWWPARLRKWLRFQAEVPVSSSSYCSSAFRRRLRGWVHFRFRSEAPPSETKSPGTEVNVTPADDPQPAAAATPSVWTFVWPYLRRTCATLLVAAVVLITVLAADSFMSGRLTSYSRQLPESWHRHVHQPLARLSSFNAYGLFQDMTTERPEIIVQVSEDSYVWKPLEFRWKPGDPAVAPRWAAPHQPRLDWQMWFAALNPGFDPRQNGRPGDGLFWFGEFLGALLQQRQPVWDLLEPPPIPQKDVKHIRARLFLYRFNDLKTRRETGEWWWREFQRPFSAEFSLRR